MLPLSHYVDDVWVTEPYDPAAFIALCATYGIEAPTVEQIMGVFKQWVIDESTDNPIGPDEWNDPMWLKQEAILRARLTNLMQP